jgi:hypothetical protein
MKPKTNAITPGGAHKQREESKVSRDYDRGLKREIGVIRAIDSQDNGQMFVLVDLPTRGGRLRPFGQDRTRVVIADSPLDILVRWGGVKPGQIVEVFYRGIGESGQAAAHIIGDETEDLVNARPIPKEGFSIESSLPFEPSGFL